MRLASWVKMLLMYFAFNKTNYARYGTWDVHTLKEIDERYPGLKPLLRSNGLSVQAQAFLLGRRLTKQESSPSTEMLKHPEIYFIPMILVQTYCTFVPLFIEFTHLCSILHVLFKYGKYDVRCECIRK